MTRAHRASLPIWDPRPPKRRKSHKRTSAPCPACGAAVVSTPSQARTYCNADCRREAMAADIRFDSYTLRLSGDACWPWQGAKDSKGYGMLSVGRRTVLAHRFALARHLGRPLGKDQALHKCNNPSCVRVGDGHLYVGDHAQNMRDLAESNHGAGSKTSWNDRLEIAEYVEIGYHVEDVAAKYSLSPDSVRRWHKHFFPAGESRVCTSPIDTSPGRTTDVVEVSADDGVLHNVWPDDS